MSAFNEISDKITNESVLVKSGFTAGDKVQVLSVVSVAATTVTNANVKIYCDDAASCH